MSEFESVHIETRGVGEMAREEVSAAREAGIDPLDLARTHDRVAAAIRNIVHWQNAADHRGRAERAVQSRELRLANSVQGDAKLRENSGDEDATENHENGRSER